jgi:antitoxin component YwqK of YwqJK toxin-antitoxin module
LAEVIYYINGRIDEKRKFLYNGNTSELKVYDKNSNLKFTQNNVFSATGKLLEESRLENDNLVSRKVEYTYDTNDNLITETKYIKGKLAGKITRVYNELKLLSEVYQETPSNPKTLINKYVYNSKNWLIEEQLRSDISNDLSKNTYTYDENGICKTIDSYYAEYKHQVLSVFVYDNY